MRIIKFVLIFHVFFFGNASFAQQGFVVNGATVTIENGASIYVHDFTNKQGNGIDGSVNLDGNIIIKGNITNNSNGDLFTNIESTPNGHTILSGNDQSIQGTNRIFFENLDIKNATKTYNLDLCEVKGVFDIDGVFLLNKNKLIIDNKNANAITYHSGYIKSETKPDEGLGEIEWKIGNATNTFNVPFGSGSGTNDINVSLTTKTEAGDDNGSVLFATYPTDWQNAPYPDIVSTLDGFEPKDLADRYWKIEPVFTSKPDIMITFKFNEADVDPSDNPEMVVAKLKAIRFNNEIGKWKDFKMSGICNPADKSITTDYIFAKDFYSYWTLGEYIIPNAFTPDGDGVNDIFLKGFSIKIINRWGEILYEGEDGWDGKTNGKAVSPGTYFFVASMPDINSTEKSITGSITVILNKN